VSIRYVDVMTRSILDSCTFLDAVRMRVNIRAAAAAPQMAETIDLALHAWGQTRGAAKYSPVLALPVPLIAPKSRD